MDDSFVLNLSLYPEIEDNYKDELVNYIQEGNGSYTGVYGNYKIEIFQYDK